LSSCRSANPAGSRPEHAIVETRRIEFDHGPVRHRVAVCLEEESSPGRVVAVDQLARALYRIHQSPCAGRCRVATEDMVTTEVKAGGAVVAVCASLSAFEHRLENRPQRTMPGK
jgi:hypothetical protein